MDTSLNSLVRSVLKSEQENSDGDTVVSPVAMDALRNYMERVPDEDGALNQLGVDAGNDYILPAKSGCWIDVESSDYVVHIVNDMATGTFVEVMNKDDVDNNVIALGKINIF